MVLATHGVQLTRSGGRCFALGAKSRFRPCSVGVRFLPGLKAEASSEEPGEGPGWDGAVEILGRLDPHRVYGNTFLDRMFP
ncbi:hypothetical protein [Streptomyces europaeiscabiei]|uniref:hypothetical protein n=1 Tax=Streptomyces europaeiscabiei TaxID=146819 RepID=UPI002E1081DA|nr:hypothetical protein OHB30_06465 [Streptomyces europaeiscabiei]